MRRFIGARSSSATPNDMRNGSGCETFIAVVVHGVKNERELDGVGVKLMSP